VGEGKCIFINIYLSNLTTLPTVFEQRGVATLSAMLVPTWDSHTTDIKKDPRGSTYICVSYGHLLLLSYISDQKNRKRVKRKKNIKIIQQELRRASTDRLYSSLQFCTTFEKG